MMVTLKQKVLQLEFEEVPYKNSRWKQLQLPPSMVLNQSRQVKLKHRLLRISAVQAVEVYDRYILVAAKKATSWAVNDLLAERIREEIAKDAY